MTNYSALLDPGAHFSAYEVLAGYRPNEGDGFDASDAGAPVRFNCPTRRSDQPFAISVTPGGPKLGPFN